MAFFIYTYTTFVSRSLMMMMMMKKIQSQCSPRQNNQGLLFEIIFLRWQSKKAKKSPPLDSFLEKQENKSENVAFTAKVLKIT